MSRSMGVRSLLSAGLSRLRAADDSVAITGHRRENIAVAAQKAVLAKRRRP